MKYVRHQCQHIHLLRPHHERIFNTLNYGQIVVQLSSGKCPNPACWQLCSVSASLKLKSNPPSSVADAAEHVFCMTSLLPPLSLPRSRAARPENLCF